MADQKMVELRKQIETTEFKRYTLSIVAGQEYIVIENLKERINKHHLNDSIVDYLVPAYNETRMTKKKKIVREKKLFPGYVFVKSQMNDKIWYVIRNTPGVRLIVGAETHPVPLTDQEYNDIIEQIKQKNERSEMVVPFKEGDVVQIKKGDFKDMKGKIHEIDVEKGFAIVYIEILGRMTPAMIGFDQLALV